MRFGASGIAGDAAVVRFTGFFFFLVSPKLLAG